MKTEVLVLPKALASGEMEEIRLPTAATTIDMPEVVIKSDTLLLQESHDAIAIDIAVAILGLCANVPDVFDYMFRHYVKHATYTHTIVCVAALTFAWSLLFFALCKASFDRLQMRFRQVWLLGFSGSA